MLVERLAPLFNGSPRASYSAQCRLHRRLDDQTTLGEEVERRELLRQEALDGGAAR